MVIVWDEPIRIAIEQIRSRNLTQSLEAFRRVQRGGNLSNFSLVVVLVSFLNGLLQRKEEVTVLHLEPNRLVRHSTFCGTDRLVPRFTVDQLFSADISPGIRTFDVANGSTAFMNLAPNLYVRASRFGLFSALTMRLPPIFAVKAEDILRLFLHYQDVRRGDLPLSVSDMGPS